MKRNEKLSRKVRLGILAAIMAGAFSIMPAAQALPTGGASGTATITTAGSTMDIASSVTNNLLTWQDFSIAQGEIVNFQGANTYLNVVTGANQSQILGALNGSEANVFLINPNGILIGDGAQVNVGSLHLSTADIKGSLDNFDTAKTALDSVATFSGDIVNKGSLTATQEITVDGANITFKNTADISASAVSAVKLKSNLDGEIHIGSTAGTSSGYTIAQGNEKDYKLVSTAAELQAINDGLSGNYMLKNDIDMSGVNDFTPLGNNSNKFTGRFDGVNYTINNLTINKSGESGIGLFGYAQNAVIENFGKVGGGVTGGSDVGAIIGYGEGGITIRNVYNTGTVNGNASGPWPGSAGGIAGFLNGSNSISQSYNTGNVTHSGRGTGGIVGRIGGTSTIDNVYNTGAVAGNAGAGGIVGWYDGNLTLTNAYNTGNVSASSHYAGGIAGVTDADFGFTQGNINISYTYNTGSITTTGNAGCNGIIRQRDGVTVSNSYYTQGGGIYGEEITAEQLKQASTFSAWGDKLDTNGSSTTAAWRIYEGDTAPLLTAFMTRKDNVVATKIYDGTASVGYTSATPSTKTSTQAEGINWVSDVTVVSPKVLTISFEPIKKEYDGTTSATVGKGTLSGVVGEDNVSYNASAATAVYDSRNAGDRTVNYSGITLTGADAGNYSIAVTAAGKGTITAAPLTLVVADVTKEYDGTTAAPNASYSIVGTLYGDDVLEGGVFAYTDKQVGTGKTVTLNGVTIKDGNAGGNYNLTIVNSTNSAITASEPADEVSTIEDTLKDAGTSIQKIEEAIAAAAPQPPKASTAVKVEASAMPSVETEEKQQDNVETAATTATTHGDDYANAPAGEKTVHNALGNEGVLTMVNKGINPPKSMDTEKVAQQNKDTKSNGENKEGE